MKCSNDMEKCLMITLSKRARQKKVIKYDFSYFEKRTQSGRKYCKTLIVFICGWWDYRWLFFFFILCCIFSTGKALLLQSEFCFLIRKGWSTVVNLRSKLRSVKMEKGGQWEVFQSPWNGKPVIIQTFRSAVYFCPCL